MNGPFICSECGEEMDEDCDMCEDCSFEEAEQKDLEEGWRLIHSTDFIQSSMLASAVYNDETQELTVTFTGGKSYTYKEVSINTYLELSKAPSAGKYFNSIKNTLVLK